MRCASPVGRIEAPGGAVRAVVTEDGDRLPTTAVVTTVNPRDVLLGLLDPPLGGRDAADIAAVHRGNVVQALVHVATDRCRPTRMPVPVTATDCRATLTRSRSCAGTAPSGGIAGTPGRLAARALIADQDRRRR